MKNKNNWIRIFFILCFLGLGIFTVSHKSSFFDPAKNTKTLQQTQEPEVKEGRVYLTYEFQAKNEKTRYIQVRLTEEKTIKNVTIDLQKHNGKSIQSKSLTLSELRTTWQVEEKLEVDKTYQIVISYPESETIPLEKVKIKYHTFHTAAFYGALLLDWLMICVLLWDWYKKRLVEKESSKRIHFDAILYLLFCGLLSYYILEFVFANEIFWDIQIYYALHNWIFCAGIYLFLLVLFNSFKMSVIIGNVFFLIWAMANRYVWQFKGQPIQPIDLLNISTAGSMAKEYTYTLSWQMIVSIILVLSIIYLTVRGKERRILVLEGKKRWGYLAFPVVGILLFVGSFCLIKNTDYVSDMNIKVRLWRNQETYNKYGIPMGFLATGKNMQVKEPEGYSKETVENLMEPYKEKALKNTESQNSISGDNTATTQETEQPNIITIMNESFADLSYIKPDLKTNVPYLSFYNSLKENTIKGHLLVSPFGGWTANSEYEYLFGHSMELLGAAIPYSQYLNTEHSTLASNLKALGYHTIAYHPHKPNNWRRASVYPNMGFDQFISRDDMEIQDSDKIRTFVSDEVDYEELYKIMEEKEEGEKEFIFNVTLQNHGGYTYDGDDFQADVQIEGANYAEANQYLTLIKKSDEALKKLITYFENYDEPVVIVFYGDHYPNLSSECYDWLYGKSEKKLSLEETQKKYSVPFFIWTNYDIQEEENVYMSTNYLSTKLMEVAGLNKTPYQEYLTELQESIPCINVNGYMDKTGTWYRLDVESEYTNLLTNYNMIQYNELFDKKNKVEDFFQFE
ncbi:MAG: sulfatase-like hydrolase/transferase [Lachnospiraceae bacterium]|nr:sulfatase-like hydrolase/transferase [Lachnospiraceae bacterium]